MRNNKEIRLLYDAEIQEFQADRFARPFDMKFTYTDREILGKKISVAEAFRYLFRRFGYPNVGWDDHKQLCGYLISTPIPDLCVYVTLTTMVSFYPTIKGELRKRIFEEDAERRYQMSKTVAEWAAKEHNVFLMSFDYDATDGRKKSYNNVLVYLGDDKFNISDEMLPKVLADFEVYLKTNGLENLPDDKQEDVFWNEYQNYKENESSRYWQMYYEKVKEDDWFGYMFSLLPANSQTKKAYKVYVEFLKSLLVPTYTRDVSHNILGDVQECKKSVAYYKHAGIAVSAELLDTEDLQKIKPHSNNEI